MIVLALMLLHAPETPKVPEKPAHCDPLPQFPCGALAQENYEFAFEHVRWLETRLPLELDKAEWTNHIRNAKYCMHRWQSLAFGRFPCVWGSEDDPAQYWRDQLQEMLGDEDFKNGKMPPVIPPWHIMEIDK